MKTKTAEVNKHEPALLNAYKSQEEVKKLFLDPTSIDKSSLERLPEPTGYRLLVLPYSGPKKTKGGVILSDQTAETIQMKQNLKMLIFKKNRLNKRVLKLLEIKHQLTLLKINKNKMMVLI
jgi:hypothetical protein